jgi:hypothetical protein
MTTRSALKSEIIDDMDRDATADGSRVLAAISAAIKFYQPKRFFFNESRSVTFSTVNGTSDYDFGSGEEITTEFYRIDAAVITESNNNHFLSVRDYRDLEILLDGNATSGRPWSYAYINRALRLYPKPDDAYTVRLTGHVKVAEPSTDDEADNLWFTEAYELIRCRAKAYLFAHVWTNPEQAAVMRVAEADARLSLQGATHDKTGAGTIIPTHF